MDRLRVLVVEDSETVRARLVELFVEAGHEVVGDTGTGEDAVTLCRALRPDLVVLDLVLRGQSGVIVTEEVMAEVPTPILVVSSAVSRGLALATVDALAAGAVDVYEKPDGSVPIDVWERGLLRAARIVARVPVVRHPRAALRRARPTLPARQVVGLGASTGGPGALRTVLSGLPADFGVPVIVVLHLLDRFAHTVPEWLAEASGRPVRFAVDGEPLPGLGTSTVLLAPPGGHLVLDAGRLRIVDTPPRHSCRPAVDAWFESLAPLGAGVTACLLTGMGRDGAAGLLAIRRAGGRTLAQDEATSVVWGMPGEAVRIDAAEDVLPLGAIAERITTIQRARGAGR